MEFKGKAKKKIGLGFGGQSIGEYVIVLSIILSAILAMQVYVQRGLQARHKDLTDNFVYQVYHALGMTNQPVQYEPYYTKSDFTVNRESRTGESLYGLGDVSRTINYEVTERQGTQNLLPGSAAH